MISSAWIYVITILGAFACTFLVVMIWFFGYAIGYNKGYLDAYLSILNRINIAPPKKKKVQKK